MERSDVVVIGGGLAGLAAAATAARQGASVTRAGGPYRPRWAGRHRRAGTASS